jgi:hypothetical protein
MVRLLSVTSIYEYHNTSNALNSISEMGDSGCFKYIWLAPNQNRNEFIFQNKIFGHEGEDISLFKLY